MYRNQIYTEVIFKICVQFLLTSAMEEFLKEIEPLIFDREEMKTPIETDQNGKVIKYMTATKVTNRIVSSINKDLTGKYYKLMYGKKAEKQM